MATKEDIKTWGSGLQQLLAQDKEFSQQIEDMQQNFTKENLITKEDYNEMFAEGVKNFRLEFGTICERDGNELVEGLKANKQNKEVAKEFLNCVEFTRQKVAQRGAKSES